MLPRLTFQPTIEGNLTSQLDRAPSPTAREGASIGLGLDVGVARNLQLGIFFAFPVGPLAGFGDFVASLQTTLLPAVLNLRFDLGTERIADRFSHVDTFVIGFGLPLRVKIHRRLAIVSGSTSARGFATPFLSVLGTQNLLWMGAALTSTDLFALEADASFVGGSLFVPIGLLIAPHPIVSFAVRTGYRLVFWVDDPLRFAGDVLTEHFVPLGLDVTFHLGRRVDLGFTATILGLIAGSAANGRDFAISLQSRWWDLQRYDLFLAARF